MQYPRTNGNTKLYHVSHNTGHAVVRQTNSSHDIIGIKRVHNSVTDSNKRYKRNTITFYIQEKYNYEDEKRITDSDNITASINNLKCKLTM